MQGVPLTLVGDEIRIGDKAPDFKVTANDLSTVTMSSYEGRTILISAVPSLDTPVCDTETKRFNETAATLSSDIVILTVSMDLPFAQARWCQAGAIEHVVTLSDYREASFGKAYGVLIDELRLLARALFLIDRTGIVRYIQLVPEIADEPDYEAVAAAITSLS